MFTQRLSSRIQKILDIGVLLLAAVVFGLLTWSSWVLAWQWFLMREVRLGAFPWPIWPFRFLFVVGMGLICLQLISMVVTLVSKAPGREGERRPTEPQVEV
jgi:TRAP-type C4-dicarboxylate transport system permease small subunit